MELYDYQKKAIEWMKVTPKSYIAIDMGMGKTAVALNWAQNILEETKGVLVIAPLRTIGSTWPEECKKWTPELTYTILHGTQKLHNLGLKRDLYFMNYEGLPWLLDALKQFFKLTGKVPFRALILDEGSMIKSHSTKRFKVLKLLCEIFPKYITILSGTPAPNSLLNLWSQYYILDKGKRLYKYITHYKRHYFRQVDRMGYVWQINEGSDQIIYKAIENITYRLDSKDYLDLPEIVHNVIKIKLPDPIMAKYKILEKDFLLSLEGEDDVVGVFSAASLSMKLRQFLQGAVYTDEHRNYSIVHKEKLAVLKSMVEEANGQGILCAIQFRFELDMIKKVFPKAEVIAGGVPARKANRIIADWNAKKVPLLLCHPASISHGVNLQQGSHLLLWYGLTWSLEQYLQLNKRLHRIGQTKTVVIHHLVVKGSVDERIMSALKAKFKTQSELLDYLRGVRL